MPYPGTLAEVRDCPTKEHFCFASAQGKQPGPLSDLSQQVTIFKEQREQGSGAAVLAFTGFGTLRFFYCLSASDTPTILNTHLWLLLRRVRVILYFHYLALLKAQPETCSDGVEALTLPFPLLLSVSFRNSSCLSASF